MNKFSQLIIESSEFEDIEDSLLNLYDAFGEPHVTKMNMGGSMAYSLRWQLDFSPFEYNGMDVIDKMSKLFQSLKEIRTAESRISGYDIDIKLGAYLFVRLTPHATDSYKNNRPEYNFIIGQNGREIQIKYSEIARYLRDNKYKIKNVENIDNEAYENSSVVIATDADQLTMDNFKRMFMSEFEKKEIWKSVGIAIRANSIEIYPEEEKTYVVIDRTN